MSARFVRTRMSAYHPLKPRDWLLAVTAMGHFSLSRSPTTSDCLGSRPCENVRERRNRGTVFSIAVFGQPPSELLVLRLKKSRRTFYAQIECRSFRTASVERRRRLDRDPFDLIEAHLIAPTVIKLRGTS